MEHAERLRSNTTRTPSPTLYGGGGGYAATGVAVVQDMEEPAERMGL